VVPVFLAVFTLCGCSKSEPPQASDAEPKPTLTSSAAVAPMAPIDTCSLLTSEEIQAVQGEPPQESKPSQHSAGGISRYDCLFTLPNYTNSISLSIAQPSTGADARDARQDWQRTFAAAAAKASEKVGPPRKLEGIGDEAYWTGNQQIGALYVLKGPRYLRISVGGAGGRDEKIRKCQTLAEAVLKRL
jgi:hypothetical protein